MKDIDDFYDKLITFDKIEDLAKILVKYKKLYIPLQEITRPITKTANILVPTIRNSIHQTLSPLNTAYEFIMNVKNESSIIFKLFSGFCYNKDDSRIALLSEIHDIVRGRIICNNTQDCFLLTEIVLSNYRLCNRFWNTIDEDDDYASIDFNILANKVICQIQIRTETMDKKALLTEKKRKKDQIESFKKTIADNQYKLDFRAWLNQVINNLVNGFDIYNHSSHLNYNGLLSAYSNGKNDVPAIRFLKPGNIEESIIKKSTLLQSHDKD